MPKAVSFTSESYIKHAWAEIQSSLIIAIPVCCCTSGATQALFWGSPFVPLDRSTTSVCPKLPIFFFWVLGKHVCFGKECVHACVPEMTLHVYTCVLLHPRVPQLFWGLPFLPLHGSIPWTGVRPSLFPGFKHNIWAEKMHFGSHLPRYFKHALYNPFKISIWYNVCCTHREYKVMPRKKRLKHNKQEERRRRKGFKKKVTEVRNTWLLCILQEFILEPVIGPQHLSTEVEQPTTAQHSLEQPSSPQPNATEVGILYMYSHYFTTHFTVLSIVCSIRLLKLSSHRPPSIYSSSHHSPNPILQRRFNLLLVYYICTTHFHFTVAYRMILKDHNYRRGQSVYQVAG